MTIDGMDDTGSCLRLLVAQALRLYEPNHLEQFLTDSSAIVRSAAARQLQLRGGHRAFTIAKNLIESTSPQNREIGVFILGQLGTPDHPYAARSAKLIAPLIKDRSHAVRAATAAAIGHLGLKVFLPEIIRLKTSRSHDVRECAEFAFECLTT